MYHEHLKGLFEGTWCLQGLDIVQEHENLKLGSGDRQGQPKRRSVDLSQLSLQDTNEEEVRCKYSKCFFASASPCTSQGFLACLQLILPSCLHPVLVRFGNDFSRLHASQVA